MWHRLTPQRLLNPDVVEPRCMNRVTYVRVLLKRLAASLKMICEMCTLLALARKCVFGWLKEGRVLISPVTSCNLLFWMVADQHRPLSICPPYRGVNGSSQIVTNWLTSYSLSERYEERLWALSSSTDLVSPWSECLLSIGRPAIATEDHRKLLTSQPLTAFQLRASLQSVSNDFPSSWAHEENTLKLPPASSDHFVNGNHEHRPTSI